MINKLLLVIDFGTGGCKLTAIDRLGKVKAEASPEYPTHHPKPFYSEQNPEDWMTSLIACLKQIREQGKINLEYIVAVSLDGSTHNAVLLDKDMRVVRPTIMWADQRSIKEVEYLERGWGGDIFRIGYQKVAPTWTLPQMLWIKNNEPENYKRVNKVMTIQHFPDNPTAYSMFNDPQALENFHKMYSIIGFRYLVTSSDVVQEDGNLGITLNWLNIGLTPSYDKWQVRFFIKNESDEEIWSGFSTIDLRIVCPDEKTPPGVVDAEKAISHTDSFQNVPEGGSLYMEIIDPDGISPNMVLSIKGRTPDGAYLLK